MSTHAISRSSTTTPALSKCPPDDLECRLRKLVEAGPAAIDERLAELDTVWTAGRAAKATAGVAILVGLTLGLTVNPWFLALPIAGGLVLAQYLFGRCSLLGHMYRGLGLPASSAVEHEKLALRALRGDFQKLPTVHQVEDTDAITRMEGEGGPAVEFDEPRVGATEAVKEALVAVRQ